MSLKNEKKILKAMIQIFCFSNHSQDKELCPECLILFQYANIRIDKCKLKPQGIVCSECQVHCFHPAKRQEIREIMRYSGKKIMWKYPVLSFRYLIRKILCKPKNS